MRTPATPRVAKRMGHVALFVALAVVPVLALNSLATADTGTDPRPAPTDAQRQCLADQGVDLPAAGTAGALSHEASKALWKASKACGMLGPRVALHRLTDAQRQCLTDQGITLPTPGVDGVRPQANPAQRAALRVAAASCGLPERGHHRDGADPKI